TAVPSGSQPGSPPWVPVRYCDQGSWGEGHRASAVGRTWRITVFGRGRTAVSRWAISSARGRAALRPGAEGQSRLPTVATQTPRISPPAAPPRSGPAAGAGSRRPRAVDASGSMVSTDSAAAANVLRDTCRIRTPRKHSGSAGRGPFSAPGCPTPAIDHRYLGVTCTNGAGTGTRQPATAITDESPEQERKGRCDRHRTRRSGGLRSDGRGNRRGVRPGRPGRDGRRDDRRGPGVRPYPAVHLPVEGGRARQDHR